MFSSLFWCDLECEFYPKEIKPELLQVAQKVSVCIPTLVYFNVLLFFSYYNLKMKQGMNCALNQLYLAVQNVSSIPIAIPLLNKCLEVMKQDHQNNWFLFYLTNRYPPRDPSRGSREAYTCILRNLPTQKASLENCDLISSTKGSCALKLT